MIRSFFFWRRRRDARDLELDDEIRAHFAMAVADRMARGESPEDAAAAARREFGNVGHVREVTRESWGAAGLWLERLDQDLRFTARSLRRSPGVAAAAIITLAVGIGATTAMFTIMNGVLLRPLPFAAPDRLYIASYNPPPGPFSRIPGLYDRHFIAVDAKNDLFDGFATFWSNPATVRGVGDPVKLSDGFGTGDFFDLLGVAAEIGSTFHHGAGDDDHVVVLSDRLWRDRFHADPRVLGHVLEIDDVARTIIGVMPPSFQFPHEAELWTPATVHRDEHRMMTQLALGRLRPGMTEGQARARWAALTGHLDMPPGLDRSALVAQLIPLKEVVVGDVRSSLILFGGAVAFVLLIACANVANLLLMRVAVRDREMAVRAALGAGRVRLVRQLLTEAFAIAAVATALGIGLAYAAVRGLVTLAPNQTLPRVESIRLDLRVLAFAIGLAAMTTVVCGLAPALHATELRLRAALAAGARTVAGGRARLRSTLVVAEIALALVLLVGAGLLIRSLQRLTSVDLGFQTADRLVATVDLPANRYTTAEQMRDYHTRVAAALARIPGVDAVGSINWRPLGVALTAGDFTIEGGPKLPPDYMADKLNVSPGYFRAAGMHVLRGRPFDNTDRAGSPGAVIISESVARKFWPAGDAVGKRISFSDKPTARDWFTIVGVVNDVVQQDISSPRDAAIYQPLAQSQVAGWLTRGSYLVHRVAPAASVAPAMREAIRSIDPSLPVEQVFELRDAIGWTIQAPRFAARLLASFSLLALGLALIGIYGVLAYSVAQRAHEIGVRMALGATPGVVAGMILRRTLMLAVPGLAIGVAAAAALTRVLANFLFHVQPTDPATFASVTGLFAVVALGAAYLPARRAARVDPLSALRSD